MFERIHSRKTTTVAALLERELDYMIGEWKRRVGLVSILTINRLSDGDRTAHLPGLFDEIVVRLRENRSTESKVSAAATSHGKVRFAQGYSVAMLVEESRILQVTTFGTLHRYEKELDRSRVLLDVVIIADEADRQLGGTVAGFMEAGSAAQLSQ